MVVVTGTATNDQDLFTKLTTFLKTNATLVSSSQAWTVAWDTSGVTSPANATDVVLKGPGASGTDQIFVGMRLSRNVGLDSFYIEFRGMTGVNALSESFDTHINVQPRSSLLFLDNGPMAYWFIANGRRFVVIVKVTTTFEAAYCGFFLPYGTPGEYPYPMFVGGSGGTVSGNASSPNSWRQDVEGHSQFPWPTQRVNGVDDHYSCAHVLTPAGSWAALSNVQNTTPAVMGPVYTRGNYQNHTTGYIPAVGALTALTDCYGGDKMLMPMPIFEVSPGSQSYGTLQGAYKCQGVGMGAEDTISIGGTNYLVVQNVYRTDFYDFWAMELT